jgi:hypothetical protein
MNNRLKISALLCALCASSAIVAAGQITTPAPGANSMPTSNFGFNLPTNLGTLSYSLSASELLQTGYETGSSVYASTAISGNLAYLSQSERAPFSAVYSGGYIHGNQLGGYNNTTFQDLALSQVFRTRSWVYVISDVVSYLPESPTTGLSGIAGVGDVGVYPVQTGIGPDQSILTAYGPRVGNGLSGSATWQITNSASLQGSASWQTLRFVGNSAPGFDSNTYSASIGPNYRINALSSVGVSAFYSRVSYPGYANFLIESEGAMVQYNRTWTRKISTTVSVGPEITHGENFVPIPAQLNLAVSASISYAGQHTGLYASYSRGTSAGSGVYLGSFQDIVSGGMNRPLGRAWSLGLNGGYAHNVALGTIYTEEPTTNSVYGGAQVSRRLTESLSCYGAYTGLDQSVTNTAAAANAYNGFSNVFSFGITFSPAPLMRSR